MISTVFRLRAFYLLTGLSGGLFSPYLSLLLQHDGLQNSEIGIVMALGTSAAIVVQPIWGYFVDRTQMIRLTLILSCLLPGLAAVLFNAHWLWFIILANIVYNLFATPLTPISDSYAVLSARQAGTSYGSIRLFASLGFATGGYLGGLYLAHITVDSLWIPYLALSALSAAIVLRFPREPVQLGVPVSLRTGVKSLLRDRRILVFFIGGFLVSETLTAFNTYFALTFQSIGGSLSLTGVAFLIASSTNVPGMLLATRVMRTIGREKVLMLASAAYVLRWVVQALIPIPSVSIAIQVLHGVSFGFYYVVAVDFVSTAAAKELQATAQSVFGMVCGGAAGIFGNLVNGFLLHGFGPQVMYGACTLCSLLGAVCFWYAGYLGRKPSYSGPQTVVRGVQ